MTTAIKFNATAMFSEASETPEIVQQLLDNNAGTFKRIGEKLRSINPAFVLTCARGSSDHAACFAKYLIETNTGLFTASMGPSIHSVYETRMQFRDSVCILISQSGASPDLLAAATAAREGGALVIALVNVVDSPLGNIAHEVIELSAGPELSVAATKSYIASLAAVVELVAQWRKSDELHTALLKSPDSLERAWQQDWSAAIEPLSKTPDLFVLGRGLGLGIAYEAALKFKEVCGLHAEGLSAAEVLHGPVAIAQGDFPVLVLAQNDATISGVRSLVKGLTDRNVTTLTAGFTHESAINLPTDPDHPVIEPMRNILSFYRMANQLSLTLGQNPDSPPFLKKVTSTV